MAKRRVYFESGEIVEATCGKSQFKQIIKTHSEPGMRMWFRDCPEWRQTYTNWNKWFFGYWKNEDGILCLQRFKK